MTVQCLCANPIFFVSVRILLNKETCRCVLHVKVKNNNFPFNICLLVISYTSISLRTGGFLIDELDEVKKEYTLTFMSLQNLKMFLSQILAINDAQINRP